MTNGTRRPKRVRADATFRRSPLAARYRATAISSRPAAWLGNAVQVGVISEFLAGRVRDDVKTIRLEYAHGAATIVHPTRGYVLVAIPPRHRARADRLVRVIGVNSVGRTIAVQHMPAPPKKARSR